LDQPAQAVHRHAGTLRVGQRAVDRLRRQHLRHPVRRIRIGGRGGWVAGDHVSPELGCRSCVIIT
jgi:hypothetical protein